MSKQVFSKSIRKLRPSKIVRPFETREELILRDYLAMQRTTLANERTLFAYIRTCLYLILGGIGLIEVRTFSHLQWVGQVALVLSALILIYGIIRYVALRRNLRKFYNTIGIKDKS